MADHEDAEDFEPSAEEQEDLINAFKMLMMGAEVEGMLVESMRVALDEFVHVRWPHLVRHEVVTEEDANNPFTGGATAAFISLIEVRTLDGVFTDLLENFDLPDELCALASLMRTIVEATDQAAMHKKLHDGAVVPPDPSNN